MQYLIFQSENITEISNVKITISKIYLNQIINLNKIKSKSNQNTPVKTRNLKSNKNYFRQKLSQSSATKYLLTHWTKIRTGKVCVTKIH